MTEKQRRKLLAGVREMVGLLSGDELADLIEHIKLVIRIAHPALSQCTPEQVEREVAALLSVTDGSLAAKRQFVEAISKLIHAIGPQHDMAHDDQVRIIALIATAMRRCLLSDCQESPPK